MWWQVLCYVLDFSGKGTDQAVEQYEALRFELECYQPGMTSRPSVVAANKMDLPNSQANFDYFQVPSLYYLLYLLLYYWYCYYL